MRVQEGDIVWKKPGAGFTGVGCYVEIRDDDCLHENASYIHDIENHIPCMLNCGDNNCIEWATAWVIDGADNLEEARKLADTGKYARAVYHLSECEIFEDKKINCE